MTKENRLIKRYFFSMSRWISDSVLPWEAAFPVFLLERRSDYKKVRRMMRLLLL
jgi:hypothetical protein